MPSAASPEVTAVVAFHTPVIEEKEGISCEGPRMLRAWCRVRRGASGPSELRGACMNPAPVPSAASSEVTAQTRLRGARNEINGLGWRDSVVVVVVPVAAAVAVVVIVVVVVVVVIAFPLGGRRGDGGGSCSGDEKRIALRVLIRFG